MVPKTAQTLAAILMLTFILTGGYFVRGVFHPVSVWLGCSSAQAATACNLVFQTKADLRSTVSAAVPAAVPAAWTQQFNCYE